MLPASLRARLLLANLLALLVAAAVAAGVMLLVRHASTEDLVRQDLDEELDELQAGMHVDSSGRVQLHLRPEVGNVYDAMPRDAAFAIMDTGGRVVLSSRAGPALDALMMLPSQPGYATVVVPNAAGPIQLQTTERPLQLGQAVYTARIARSDRLVVTLKNHAEKLYLRAGSAMVAVALLTFAAVIYLTVTHMLRPLSRASRVAAAVGPRNLGARLRSAGLPSEVVPLIDAFNAALERLQHGYTVQQQFLASAAHELKTPLALLQAEIELSNAPNKAMLLRDTAQMARQVHQLLHLAEVSEGHNYTFAPVQVSAVVQDAVDYMARLSAQHGVAIVVEVPDEEVPLVDADASAVFVLAKNLLENAIHHSPRGSMVRVHVHPGGFDVSDEGPGVTDVDAPLLFVRFWRGGGEDGEGAGLGLAICQEICQSHGWRIALAPRPPGTGACFTVDTRVDVDGARGQK